VCLHFRRRGWNEARMPQGRRYMQCNITIGVVAAAGYLDCCRRRLSTDLPAMTSAEMDPHGLCLRVVAERLPAPVAAGTGLLSAAPGLGHAAMVEAVDPDHACLDVAPGVDRGVEVLGPDAGGQAIDRVVGDRDRVVEVLERQHGADRAEDLLLRNLHLV